VFPGITDEKERLKNQAIEFEFAAIRAGTRANAVDGGREVIRTLSVYVKCRVFTVFTTILPENSANANTTVLDFLHM